DLIIEVISDDSVGRDRAAKFEENEEAGVREYWIIDPRPKRRRADFYQLGADGKYKPVPIENDGVYRSLVLKNFWLNVNWMWQDPLPKVMQVLSEIEKKQG
ncbi:MAG: Uma2 family endonuclease, partial [Chloroflexi bacterium]|nr:Uma2 family endonuclease [Chloroflexota bacterium]